VADPVGTYELTPASGRVLLRTGREGLAARVGHDLVLEITQWSARVTVPAEGSGATETVTAELDLGSLAVREGSGGAKPLSDRDRRDIQNQARKILGHATQAIFNSTRVLQSASPVGGSGAIEGTLLLNAVTQSVRFQVTAVAPGRYRGSGTIRQTDFGITPYSGFFGALKLRDEVTVEFEVTIKELQNGAG
jgi:hypothetical protein